MQGNAYFVADKDGLDSLGDEQDVVEHIFFKDKQDIIEAADGHMTYTPPSKAKVATQHQPCIHSPKTGSRHQGTSGFIYWGLVGDSSPFDVLPQSLIHFVLNGQIIYVVFIGETSFTAQYSKVAASNTSRSTDKGDTKIATSEIFSETAKEGGAAVVGIVEMCYLVVVNGDMVLGGLMTTITTPIVSQPTELDPLPASDREPVVTTIQLNTSPFPLMPVIPVKNQLLINRVVGDQGEFTM
ncbi:hypothetical protein IFM89_027870 [Coptis chinensis]|uniref:Uncharacterized protein n=1 Tax=Coptis chinensis TaxID=261450 RepID=A0A835HHH1_9MAGN|nr:hypothetical protein IFM89_027870 [Coptis chinensis]